MARIDWGNDGGDNQMEEEDSDIDNDDIYN